MIRRIPARALAAALVVSASLGVLAAPSRAGATTGPQVLGCTPGEQFVKSSQSQKFYGTGHVTWFYNQNATSASESLTTSTTNTIGFSISSSQSVDAGVIFASADVSFSEGVTYTHNDAESVTTTVSAPAGKYGILQIGNQMGIVKGTYQVINSTCQITEQTTTTGIFPLDEGTGTGAGNSTSPTPPWPQSTIVSS